METISGGYNWVLVALSFIISAFGSFTSLQLARQIRLSPERDRLFWLSSAAFAMGGGAIWSMHFIAMLALDLGMQVNYDLVVTLASLVIAIVVTGVGFVVIGRGGRKISRFLVGGVLMGLGIAGMHYTGMAAMRMPAVITYSVVLVVASIVVAVAASFAALWLAFNPRRAWQSIASALVMATAVSGMHYTAMAAATFRRSARGVGVEATAIPTQVLAYGVFLVSLIILAIGLGLGIGQRAASRARKEAYS